MKKSAERITVTDQNDNCNEAGLVQTTYWDSLAILQQTRDLEKTEQRKKFLAEKRERKAVRNKIRDKKIVNLYLKMKFPDAFHELGAKNLPEKEFPTLLKRAKRSFRLKLAAGVAVSSSIFGGAVAWLASLSTFGSLHVLGVIGIIFSLFISVMMTYGMIYILRKGEELCPYPTDKYPSYTGGLGG